MKALLRRIKRSIVGNVNRRRDRAIIITNQLYYSIFRSKVECNICHYKVSRFNSNVWHLYTDCFRCGSDIRHRLLWATLEHLEDFSLSKLIKNKAVLHFAPEKAIGDLIKPHTSTYKTADFLAPGYHFEHIDYNIDISNMPEIADASFDCAIACDVLEHVTDHIGGLKEIYRILKKGGYCIITIPQRDNLANTYEDNTITTPAGRKIAYGQDDHLRIYGSDFSTMMQNCAFKVTVIDETSFTKEIVERNVLFPPVLSTLANVTNYRKVYIGQK